VHLPTPRCSFVLLSLSLLFFSNIDTIARLPARNMPRAVYTIRICVAMYGRSLPPLSQSDAAMFLHNELYSMHHSFGAACEVNHAKSPAAKES
jgi:hypothetical protein